MRFSKRSGWFILKFILFYFLLLAAVFVVLLSKGNYRLVAGTGNARDELNLLEISSYLFYKYLLNFPLGFFNWFTDEYLFTTGFVTFLNAIAISVAIVLIAPKSRKTITYFITYLSIGISAGIVLWGAFLLLEKLGDMLV